MFKILTKPNCVHCTAAKQAMNFKSIPYEEELFQTENDYARFKELGYRTFPQVFDDNGNHIGGNMELQNWLIENK